MNEGEWTFLLISLLLPIDMARGDVLPTAIQLRASVLTLQFMGEPVENAKFDASTSFFFAMKKEKLLQLCKYYKGEERCPETNTTDAARKLWRAEYMICNNLSDMVKVTKLRESFIGAVCAYVEKWDPYFHHEVIDLYLEQQKRS